MEEILELFDENPQLYAPVILVGGILAGFIVNLIVTRVLSKLAARTVTTVDDEIIEAIHKPLFLTVVLISTAFALRQLEPSDTAYFICKALLITAGALIWSRALNKVGKVLLDALARRADAGGVVQPRTLPVFQITWKAVVFLGAAYAILLAWHVDVTAWLASAGIIGIAIGFAAKDTLSNLFSGVFILADAPYKLGDFIVLDSGERGEVTHIGIRSTRMLTRDDIEITIPNAAIANAKIVNETGGPWPKERVRVKVGVAYDSDVDQVRQVLLDVAADSPMVGDEPHPRVRFRRFGDSSLDFELLAWIEEPVTRGRALDALNTAVFKAFAEHGITIPFPQRDVHMKEP